MKKKLYGNNVLITGASSGIGKAASELFAEKGYTVYAVSRSCDEKKIKYESGGSINTVPADVTDLQSLKALFLKIHSLDIVIHCAGYGVSGSIEYMPLEDAHKQLETNYFGVMNVNSLALPLLRKNKNSLVLITSSVAGLIPIPFQSHYSSSKYALEAYGEALRMEAKSYGVNVCLVEPGDTKTGFTKARKNNEPEFSPYYKKCIKAVSKMEKDEQNGKDPKTVAKVFYLLTKKKNPKVRTAVGIEYKILCFLSRVMPVKIKEYILTKLY